MRIEILDANPQGAVPPKLYVLTDRACYTSTNNGVTWVRVPGQPPREKRRHRRVSGRLVKLRR